MTAPADMTWSRERIDAVWRDLESPRERPVKLLRARFRKGLDLRTIEPSLADDIAALFLLWGALQVKESWLMSSFDRRTWLGEARTLFDDATRAASSDELRNLARFDRAVVDFLLGLTPRESGGILMMSGFILVVGEQSIVAHDLDENHFIDDLRRAFDGLAELGESGRELHATVAGLLGLCANSCKVHERIAWLRLAESGTDETIAAASREMREQLKQHSAWTRRFGRDDASAADLVLPIDIMPDALLRLPPRASALLERWNELPAPPSDGPYRSN